MSGNGTGRLEVFFRGEWGTVCDDYWDINGAEVACRQLGYPYAIRAPYYWQVPDGTGPIWLDDVRCNGNEKYLRECSHRGWGSHNCYHYRDAGVQCSLTGKTIISKLFVLHDFGLEYTVRSSLKTILVLLPLLVLTFGM